MDVWVQARCDTPALSCHIDGPMPHLDVTPQGISHVRLNPDPTEGAPMHTVVIPVHPDPAVLTFDTVVKAKEVHAVLVEAMDEDTLGNVDIIPARSATVAELARVHDLAYIVAVRTGEPEVLATSNGIGWDPHLFDIAAGSSGSIRDAALEALATGGIVGALATGLHHARRDRGNGYCTFNGIALALRAVADAGARRALVLDVDGHCGGGTASLINSIPGAEQLDISVHHYDSYASTDRCRLVMTDGDRYLETLENELEHVVDPAGIDLVIHNAGMDIHEGAGGVPGISTAVIAERERMIFEWARRHRLPVAWTLAGGYTSSGMSLRRVAELHLLTAKAALATLN
jgi:acetoin utilization deacetylase AcuC-like enzyme